MSVEEGDEVSLQGDEVEEEETEEEDLGQEDEEEEDGQPDDNGVYNATEVVEDIFEELVLPPVVVEDVQRSWRDFLATAESREAAGEAIYAALFDSAPSLQNLFKTPRAVMAMRFMQGLHNIIGAVHEPKDLKTIVETLGFQHLDLEVTSPRVIIFRDAIVDLMAVELADRLSPSAIQGLQTLLNYVGGAYIYIRVKFSERLKILSSSWAAATKKPVDEDEAEANDESGGTPQVSLGEPEKGADTKTKSGRNTWFKNTEKSAANTSRGDNQAVRNATVPQTFSEMFMFNATVMGFGNKLWMQEILASFDTIVTNVSNSYRLQEECDVLALRMAKYKGTIVLSEYKAVMLASLRSLVKEWGSSHELAWSWLWENVERVLEQILGKPAQQERALVAMLGSLDEAALGFIRREVYAKFFALAPAGQDFFKQSTTRLHFIADRLVSMTLDIYKEPKKMVEDLSAMGLRHVGYGIPTDMFGPFVTACVQTVREMTDDLPAEEAFRWSLNLISRILCRVITEGSTIVMKAINVNSAKLLRKAVACAPRGKRAMWVLNVQVGTQSISPLVWAIETGSLDASRAILVDLLTIRADRDRYYYGMDTLFERHPDIIQRLCLDAPGLLKTLLDGLIWRSRVTQNGFRRVNYYVKHMLVDKQGDFAKASEWLVSNNDPELICHPVVAIVIDMVWGRCALRTFLFGKTWFLFTILIFLLSQCILNRMGEPDEKIPKELRIAIFALRLFTYIFSMGRLLVKHAKWLMRDIRNRDFLMLGKIPIPQYLTQWHPACSLALLAMLLVMLALEPILHCLSSDEDLFTIICDESENVRFSYALASTLAILLYFVLVSDLAVFSTRVSAYALVCTRLLTELALFLFALTFIILAFACALCALMHENDDFSGIGKSLVQLYKMVFGMFSGYHYDLLDEPAILCTVFLYVVVTVVFLANLLVAQLNCAYQASYQDMVGFARLNRGKIVVDTMPSVPRFRWEYFLKFLALDERIEFGEGDIGLSGGIQVLEPANQNPTTQDTVHRYAGSTSPSAQWPAEDTHAGDEEDRFERMERLMEKAIKRMSGSRKGGSSSQTGSSMGYSTGSVSEEGKSSTQ